MSVHALPTLVGQGGILFLGLLHAAAAYFYFSRTRHALLWAAGWIVLSVVAALTLRTQPLVAFAAFATAILLWTAWWASIRARPNRSWVAENARQATAELAGRELRIKDLRNFRWLAKNQFDARWEDATVNLDAIEAADLFVSTWGDPRIAHLIVSFVIRGAEPLAFSIETRRETDESWSSLAGFMKSYELICIAARETDVIRVRTNIRGETVRRYRLGLTPAMCRKLFMHYVDEMNALARRPRFYNTLFANCTTEIVRILRAAGRRLPWAPAVVVLTGQAPRYFHAKGLLEPGRSFEEIEAGADIGARARAADAMAPAQFSARIRDASPPR